MRGEERIAGRENFPHPEEIDLVDIGTLFWRYRWLFVGVFLGAFIPGALFAFLQKDEYSVVTAIEVGLITVDGEVQPVEPIETVAAKLRNGYIPTQLHAVDLPPDIERKSLAVEVVAKDSGSLVVLKSEARTGRTGLYRKIHTGIVEQLVADHARVTNVIQGNLEKSLALANIRLEELRDRNTLENKLAAIRTDLTREKLELASLRNPKIYQVTRKDLENALAASREKLTGLDDRIKYLQSELTGLDTSSELVNKQIGEIRDFLQTARERRPAAVSAVEGGADAMTAMLLDAEIQKSVERLSRLEDRLYAEIPTRRVALNNELEDARRQKLLQREEIALLESKLTKLDLEHQTRIEQKVPLVEQLQTRLDNVSADHSRQIQQQVATVNALETQLENLRKTRAVTPPQVSLKPVGIGSLAMLAMVILASGILAVMAVMLSAFVRAVYEKIQNDSKAQEEKERKSRFTSHSHAA